MNLISWILWKLDDSLVSNTVYYLSNGISVNKRKTEEEGGGRDMSPPLLKVEGIVHSTFSQNPN